MPNPPSSGIIVKIVHDAPTSHSHTIAIVAIVAGVIGTLLGTLFGHYLSNKRENEKDHRQTIASLKAMRAELKTIWVAYMKGPGKEIEERISSLDAKKPLGRYPAIPDSFFTVYSNNAPVLGKLEDDRLTESIVLAYQRMIGLFGAIELNNEFHKEVSHSAVSSNENVRAMQALYQQEFHKKRLNALADELEVRHQQIKPEMEKLFNSIDQYLQEKNLS